MAGAGLDVFAKEPCTDSPLFELDQVVATPHLGASTDEAQERAGIAVAVSVRKALAGDLVPDAVNVKGGAVHEEIRPSLPLVEKMAEIATAYAGGLPQTMEVSVLGEIAVYDAAVLATSALKGAIETTVDEDVTYVNAPKLAEERGMSATVKNDPHCEQFRSSIKLHVGMADGRSFDVEGTLVGIRKVEKIVSIDGFGLDLSPGKHMIFLRYMDKPGVIGAMGSELGKAGVNIAGMQVSRREIGGMALMALTVDDHVSENILEGVKKTTGADLARTVDLEK